MKCFSLDNCQKVIFMTKNVVDQKLRNLKGYIVWNLKKVFWTNFEKIGKQWFQKKSFPYNLKSIVFRQFKQGQRD